jgi:putative MATE family efflux protein
MPQTREARFTKGSTMRHVVVMTTTASVGFLFLFLVDFLTLFYVSLLRDVRLVAGVGLASFVQHVVSAVAIGLAVAATALVSQALGARNRERARSRATSCLTASFLTLTVIAALVFAFRHEAVELLMEPGPATAVATRYLAWILPSLPLLGLGISTAAILRAEGDARRALTVTMVAGGVAFVLDPLVILGLGLGVDGAAWVLVLARIVTALVGLHFVVRVHELAAPLRLGGLLSDLRAIFAVGGPSVMAQLSTPSGFLLLTAWVGRFGDSAVAGWSVVTRMVVLGFSGIIALAVAVGGIFGQNYGARKFDRVEATFRDSVVFGVLYAMAAWAVLWIGTDLVVWAFGMTGEGAGIVRAFCRLGAGGFVLASAAYVATAAFNNLGRPIWATILNWSRAGLAVPAMVLLLVGTLGGQALVFSLGSPGVVYAYALGSSLAGVIGGFLGWRFVKGLARTPAGPDS